MRRAIIILSVIGVVFIGLSAGLFLLNNSLVSSIYLVALILLLAGLAASLIASFLCIVHLLRRLFSLIWLMRQREREAEASEVNAENGESRQSSLARARINNARERRRQMFWTLAAFAAMIIILNIISNTAKPYAGLPQFGAFVALAAVLIPLLTLLYGVVSKDARKM